MDAQTHRYYESLAGQIAERYDQVKGGIDTLLPLAFTPGMRVLDVGAGSGRDVGTLLDMGIDAYGVEPSDQLRAAALQRHPELLGRLEHGELPGLQKPFGGQFDGILCSAVLMHLPREEMFDAAVALRDTLKDNGRLLVSIPADRPDIDEHHRDRHGRLFTPLKEEYLALLFERLGFQQVGKWHTADATGRKGHSWCTLLFYLRHAKTVRPLDEIAGILSRDKKTATYKLALFRALAELAITAFEQARWDDSGTVALPIDVVAEKWLFYYWPLVESGRFIPQIRGEKEGCQKPIAFRGPLSELIGYYSRSGGLARFVLDWRSNKLADQPQRLLKASLSKIHNTIVTGPVTYAGGSLERGRVFGYDASKREMRMPAAIWRELSLLGYWIQDAIILKWAELTSEISRGEIKPSAVIDLLLVTPLPERDVADARQTYTALPQKECAWSGQPIAGNFEVDHIIPFSLWHNNDLWNLVPALPAVNHKKGDRLPTRDLLLRRKDYVVYCWQALRVAHQPRFEYEVGRVMGADEFPENWQNRTFGCVAEAVEVTAVQRGHERWQP
jgi:SAM-dependent methyltransferase